MSAFFIAINRKKTPFDPCVADRMMSQLDHFGHDAKHLVVHEHFAIGYQSHWAVPEEVGERQPLEISNQHWFVFYGRLDNRDALITTLLNQYAKVVETGISDAALAQCYLEVCGIECLQDFIGPFVLVSFNVHSDELIFARDGMGGRSLSYRISDDYVLAASYEMALVAHPSMDYRLNDETVSRYFVNQMQNGPSSMVAGLDVLSPGHMIRFEGGKSNCTRFYTPDPTRRVVFDTDDEYAAEFKRLLAQAVSRRLRSRGEVGSQLSGGMDSVPVTILAATHFADNQTDKHDKRLTAYSWVFDKFSEADEQQYSGPVCRNYNIEQIKVNCDALWVNYDRNAKLDPLGPIYNPFMAYNRALFEQASRHSLTVMLNGIHGDILYAYTNGILYELLKSGEFKAFLKEMKTQLKRHSSLWLFIKDSVLKPLKVVNSVLSWRFQRTSIPSDILQPKIIKQLMSRKPREDYLVKESCHALRPQQWQIVLGDFAGGDAAIGRFLEAEYKLERRYPFRDRDLCEFMLAIPSSQLAFNNVSRPIVKRAFSAEFPDNLLNRNIKAYFADVTIMGVRNDSENVAWGNSTSREWSYYVKECYFDGKVEQNHLLEVVKWRCGYYDYWKSVCYYPMAEKLGLSDET